MVIVEMKRHFKERAIEWWSAGLATLWGAYVLINPGMFEKMSGLQGLLFIAPQAVIGLFAFTVGMLRLLALTINGFWHRTPSIRLITSFFGVCVWFWVLMGMMKSGVNQPGIIVYTWILIGDLYSVYRCASDTVQAESQKRLKELATTGTIPLGGKTAYDNRIHS